MNNEADTDYACSAGNSPGERTRHTVPPTGRHEKNALRRISLHPQKVGNYPYPGKVPRHSIEHEMKEINATASCCANQCKVIGNLPYFSEKIRRGIALKQRFRPGDGVHPLFLTT
ncbi:MAG: hypothetical protein HN531_05480 [Opitutae bacterium]|nr:hypothetical protein [Opitutae bacterium]